MMNTTPDSWIQYHPIMDEPDPDICPDCHEHHDECFCEPEEFPSILESAEQARRIERIEREYLTPPARGSW
jgi:hypothetical protein